MTEDSRSTDEHVLNRSSTKFSRYLRALAVELTMHPEWRPGQAAVNVTTLYEEFRELPPGLSEDDDPFHRDDRVPAFLAALEEHWRSP